MSVITEINNFFKKIVFYITYYYYFMWEWICEYIHYIVLFCAFYELI